MEKRFARILSITFHPLLMPTYALLLIFSLQAWFSMEIPPKAKLILLSFVFFMTFALPFALTFLMLKFRIINSFEMHTRNERIIPLLMMAFLFYITYYSIKDNGIYLFFQLFILGSSILVLLSAVINYFTKISIHMVSIGGLLGTIIGLELVFHVDVLSILIIVVLVAGLLGYARLRLQEHNQGQVYGGFLLGSFVMLLLYAFI